MITLLVLALTSTATRHVYRVEEPYEKTAEYFAELDEEDRELEIERLEILERWYAERDPHFTMRAGVRANIKSLAQGSIEVAFGFFQRFHTRYGLQGTVTFGTGLAATDKSDQLEPLVDFSADVTLRIGERRFYVGLGPLARTWRVFAPGESFRAGGGALLEFGFLAGDDREIEIILRANVGGFRRDGVLDYWLGKSAGVGYHF